MTDTISQKSLEVFASRSLGEHADLADSIKQKAALMLDQIERIPEAKYDNTVKCYKDLAKSNLEAAVMWAVKACSRV